MEQVDRLNRPVQTIFWLFLGFTMLLFAAKPIADPDFWWHLDSGRRMWEQGWLIDTSAFQGSNRARADLILHGYWLWEIVAFGLYKTLGYWGIFLLKALTVSAIAWAVLWRMFKLEVKPGVMMLVCTLGFVIFEQCYYLERPQIFSFLFAAVLLGFFDQVRQKEKLDPLLIPLMILWGNIHGGVVVGDLLLMLFGAGMAWEWRKRKRDLCTLLFWVAGGIAGSLLQPNTYHLFSIFFDFSSDRSIYSMISEYDSTFALFSRKEYGVAGLWLLISVHAAALLSSKNKWLPDILIFGFLAVFSLKYFRNIGFFAVSMLPASAYYINKVLVDENILRTLKIFSTIAIVFLSIIDVKQHRLKMIDDGFPRKMSDFLLANKIQGNMLNDYTWGGYLLWRLHPTYQPLVDGRILDIDTFKKYMRFLLSSSHKNDFANEQIQNLTDLDIDFIVFSDYVAINTFLEMHGKMIESGHWIPVYSDDNGYILVKSSDMNANTIKRFGMNVKTFYGDVLRVLDKKIEESPSDETYATARATVLDHLRAIEQANPSLSKPDIPGE